MMGRMVRVEFEEVAGYAQRDTVRLWVDGKEVVDGLEKGTALRKWLGVG